VGDIIVQICADPIPAPSSIVPELGPAVDRFFEKALARNPTLRFQSALQMTLAFDEAVGVVSEDGAAEAPAGPLPDGSPVVVPRSEETRALGPQTASRSERGGALRSRARRGRMAVAAALLLATIAAVVGFLRYSRSAARAASAVAVAPPLGPAPSASAGVPEVDRDPRPDLAPPPAVSAPVPQSTATLRRAAPATRRPASRPAGAPVRPPASSDHGIFF
jgi:serine/threonine-protein kinase